MFHRNYVAWEEISNCSVDFKSYCTISLCSSSVEVVGEALLCTVFMRQLQLQKDKGFSDKARY